MENNFLYENYDNNGFQKFTEIVFQDLADSTPKCNRPLIGYEEG
jgi:hypothetical protein